jgi:hypothetical protein
LPGLAMPAPPLACGSQETFHFAPTLSFSNPASFCLFRNYHLFQVWDRLHLV